jgi:hypothetical protein
MVVLDDIATLYRFSDPSLYDDFAQKDSTFARDRSGDLWRISSMLRQLACVHDVSVIVVNQVTAVPSFMENEMMCGGLFRGGNTPALGLVWSHCVGMRIMIWRGGAASSSEEKNIEHHDSGERKNILRYASVLKSVNMPDGSEVKFVIEERGARLIKRA